MRTAFGAAGKKKAAGKKEKKGSREPDARSILAYGAWAGFRSIRQGETRMAHSQTGGRRGRLSVRIHNPRHLMARATEDRLFGI